MPIQKMREFKTSISSQGMFWKLNHMSESGVFGGVLKNMHKSLFFWPIIQKNSRTPFALGVINGNIENGRYKNGV